MCNTGEHGVGAATLRAPCVSAKSSDAERPPSAVPFSCVLVHVLELYDMCICMFVRVFMCVCMAALNGYHWARVEAALHSVFAFCAAINRERASEQTNRRANWIADEEPNVKLANRPSVRSRRYSARPLARDCELWEIGELARALPSDRRRRSIEERS